MRHRFPILIAVLISLSSPSTFAALVDDPCFSTSQTQLLCTYLFKNAEKGIRAMSADFLRLISGQKTAGACMRDAFRKNPRMWEVLEVTRGRRYPSARNQLMVFNTEEGLDPIIKKTKGVCWGNATMKSYLTRLAFFDPRGKFEPRPVHPEGSPEWVKFYIDKIWKLTEGEPAIVPGFADLRDFSSHPKLRDWFVRRQVELWAERAAHIRNLTYRHHTRDFTTEQALEFLADVEKRLALGYNPKIMFDENSHGLVEGYKDSLHVVQVLGVYRLKNDKVLLDVLDDKAPHPRNREQLFINLRGGKDKKHAIGVFMPWRSADPRAPREAGNGLDMGGGYVNQFRITPENDAEAMRMTLNLADFCEKNPRVCEELGDSTETSIERPELQDPGHPWKRPEYLD